MKSQFPAIKGLNSIGLLLVRQAQLFEIGSLYLQILFSGARSAGHYTLLYSSGTSDRPSFYCSCHQGPSAENKDMMKYIFSGSQSSSRYHYDHFIGQRQSTLF